MRDLKKKDLLKVAKREKTFSTLAKKEGQGAEKRSKEEAKKGLKESAKDSRWEARIDKQFARIREAKANLEKKEGVTMITYIKSIINKIFDFGSGTFEDIPFADASLNSCRHEFQKWAFGDNYSSLDVNGKIDHWNVAHGGDYLITPNQNVNAALKQMIILYNQKKIRDLDSAPETVTPE